VDRAGEDARRPRRHGVEDAAPPRAQKRPKPQPHSVPSPSESSQSRPNRPSPPRDRGPTCPLGYPHPRSPASGGVPAPARQRLPRPPTRGPHCLLRRPQGRRPLPPTPSAPGAPPMPTDRRRCQWPDRSASNLRRRRRGGYVTAVEGKRGRPPDAASGAVGVPVRHPRAAGWVEKGSMCTAATWRSWPHYMR
jgi:hypothetical protein